MSLVVAGLSPTNAILAANTDHSETLVVAQGKQGAGNYTEISAGGESIFTSGGFVVAKSLPVNQHLNCMVRKDAKTLIGTYSVKREGSFSGKVKLLCGTNDTGGYRHIDHGHKQDWFKKLNWKNNASESQWDGFMFAAVKTALSKPTRVVAQKGSKLCYQTNITQTHYQGGKVKDKRAWPMKAVVAKNNMLFITAIPGGKC